MLQNYYNEFLNGELASREIYAISNYGKSLTTLPSAVNKKILRERVKFNTNLNCTISFKQDGRDYYDRLFFDFDIENNKEKYKSLKTSADKRDMLFNTDMLEIPLYEVSKLYDFLSDEDFKPYVVFSGSKGFHCYTFYDAVPLDNYNLISRKYGELFVDKLKLTTLDFNVFTNRRQARLPYSRHKKTDLFVTPIDINSDVETILHESLNPPIRHFKMSDYIVNRLSEEILSIDIEISNLIKKEKELRDKKRDLERKRTQDICYHNYVDFSTIDMRDLVRNVASDYFVKSQANYDIYNCMFHDDNHHSCGCYEKRFYCSACGKSWDYYDFIKDFYGLTEKKEIINEVKKHI